MTEAGRTTCGAQSQGQTLQDVRSYFRVSAVHSLLKTDKTNSIEVSMMRGFGVDFFDGVEVTRKRKTSYCKNAFL